MENKIKIFENDEFGKVRTIVRNGEPWFVGKDVAVILGYSNTKKALSDHVDDEDKYQGDGVTIRDPMGRLQNPTVINESGLYSLILSSKMPRAKEFKMWVTSSILPTIRRTGGYVANEDMFIENYLPFLDEPYQNLFRLQMMAINQLIAVSDTLPDDVRQSLIDSAQVLHFSDNRSMPIPHHPAEAVSGVLRFLPV